jgi:hypothetical protein
MKKNIQSKKKSNSSTKVKAKKALVGSQLKLKPIVKHKVKFIEGSHEYFVDGKKVMSVTEILDKYSDHLDIFNDYANIPLFVLQRAAEKGTKLHKEIELFEKNNTMNDSIELRNYIKLKKELGFKVKFNEILVVIKNNFDQVVAAGRLDMVIEKDGQAGIIDIKRTSKFYYQKVTAQINLYKIGLLYTYGIEASQLYCLRLREDVAEAHKIDDETHKIYEVLDLIK